MEAIFDKGFWLAISALLLGMVLFMGGRNTGHDNSFGCLLAQTRLAEHDRAFLAGKTGDLGLELEQSVQTRCN